jgi:hypothetical protein
LLCCPGHSLIFRTSSLKKLARRSTARSWHAACRSHGPGSLPHPRQHPHQRLMRPFQQLLPPGINLIGVNLIALRQIGRARLLPHRFHGGLRLQRCVDLPSRFASSSSAPVKGRDREPTTAVSRPFNTSAHVVECKRRASVAFAQQSAGQAGGGRAAAIAHRRAGRAAGDATCGPR